MHKLAASKAWTLLEGLAKKNKDVKIIDYFNADPERFSRMSIKAAGVFIDFSKNKIDHQVLSQLIKLAQSSKLSKKVSQLFEGEVVNRSEGRPALHTALRNRSNTPVIVDGVDVMPSINAALSHMQSFSDSIRNQQWLGYTGKAIRNIVNIGIGGSDLGPHMVCSALSAYQHPQLSVLFISNVDSSHIQATLKSLDPEQTLFIISSKSFTTQETLLNANSAKKWFLAHAKASTVDISKHFVAVSANTAAVEEFGIASENIFEFWEWVGGRYSLWSSIGLPIALSIGYDNFVELLCGAHAMDCHFKEAKYEDNLPVLLALIGIWNINFIGSKSQAVIPYDQGLHHFPAFLQQLDMESNGKSVDEYGESLDYATGPIIWGQTGSHGQHAFFQHLHQGKSYVPIDFIASLNQDQATPEHNEALLTNMLAQAEAFMLGSGDVQSPHEFCLGDKPSNLLLLDDLSPKSLGALIALYEHKVFVQGVIWGINSFDQWGVQLGKKLAKNMVANLGAVHDSSTQNLLSMIKASK